MNEISNFYLINLYERVLLTLVQVNFFCSTITEMTYQISILLNATNKIKTLMSYNRTKGYYLISY